MIKRITLLLFSILFFSSCTDPNVYTALNLYDPLKESKGEVSTIEIKGGEDFNLLTLSDDYQGTIRLTYKAKESYEILKELDEEEVDLLIQSLYYLRHYGNLREYLDTPLDERTKEICENTKAFAYEIIEEIDSLILKILEETNKVYPNLDTSAITSFFSEIKKILDPGNGCSSIEDYIAIQLTLDMVASTIDMLCQILICLPGEVAEYLWTELTEMSFWSEETTAKIIRDNAVSLIKVFLASASELDQVAGAIPSFINLSTIIGAFL